MPSLILSLIFIIFFFLAFLKYLYSKKNKPIVIGILAQPSYFPELHSPQEFHYIGACYANQLKAEGAYVIPIIITKTNEEILELLQKINGVIIPGGDLNLFDTNSQDGYDRFTQITKLIFDYSIELWEKHSIRFPVWGTCQGFESLLIVASQKKQYNEILEEFNHYNSSRNLQLTKNIQATMFNQMTQEQLDYSQKGRPFFYWHSYGISPAKFNSIEGLDKYFNITSTSTNQKGEKFVATFEGKNGIPIYASQFHPERVFVWLPDRNINHSPMSFNTNQYFGKFLINQAKENNHCFKNSNELSSLLIETNNYSLEKVSKAFMLCYFFKIE